MKIIKIVCDTNVILSAVIFGGNPDKILRAIRDKKLQLYTTNVLLLEIAKKLDEKFGWEELQIKQLILYLGSISIVVKPKMKINLIKDEPDNRVLECALTTKANVIISGDKRHLLSLKVFRGIPIVSPAEFLSEIFYP